MKVSYIAINAILFTSSASYTAAISYEPLNGNTLNQCFPSNIPTFSYQGDDYIFTRMKYNSMCTDSNDNQYQWGKIEGFYPPINEPNSGCAAACVSGYGRGDARGCSSMQPDKLVGFEYDCDESACYCLYEKNTWSDETSPCFDSMGGLSNQGDGDVYNTDVLPGSTCYSLFVQPTELPPEPQPRGRSICTGAPDYHCYKTGRPACCSDDEYTCPDFMTMCDNHPENMSGMSYCTWSPDYTCTSPEWSSTRGRPNCCLGDGGDIMNCPIDPPACHPEDTADDASNFLARGPVSAATSATVGATKTATRAAGQASKTAMGAARGATKTATTVTKKVLEPVSSPGSTPFPTESPYSETPTQQITPFPTEIPDSEAPTEAPLLDICIGTPDFECYSTGYPACCSNDVPCPDYMTMCDNHPENDGTSYCEDAPQYGCDPATWSNFGWPKCCDEYGGMNCPIEQPACYPEDEDTDDDASMEDDLTHLSASNFLAQVFQHAMRTATGSPPQQETKYLRAAQK